jgi:hypothetical protein
MGLKNIARVAGYLVEATCDEGEDYRLLENMHGRLLNQRARELGHVANVVGGFVRTNLWYGDADRIYAPVEAAEQRKAVQFLNEHAFHVPKEIISPAIMLRLEANGVSDRILSSQRTVLNSLINDGRVKRMAEQAHRDGGEVYAPAEMLADVRKGIWSELDQKPVKIDLYRRNLQRAYVEHVAALVVVVNSASDLPAFSRGELQTLHKQISALPADQMADSATTAHLLDVKARIDQALDPRGKAATQ